MNKSIIKAGGLVLSAILTLSMLSGCTGGSAGGSSAAASSAAASSAAVSSAVASSAAASTTAVSSFAVSGEIKATDYVLGFHRYFCTGDKSAAEAVKLESGLMKQVEEARSKMNVEGLMGQSLENNMLEMIKPETIKDFADAFISLMGKVTATATEESRNGDVVKVKVSSDTIDLSSVFRGAIAGELENLGTDSSEEQIKKAVDNMFKAMSDGMWHYEFPKEKESATVEVKKSGDSWVFVDSEEAGNALVNIMLKMDFD